MLKQDPADPNNLKKTDPNNLKKTDPNNLKNTDPNNLKKTVVNILVLNYNKCWVNFSLQVNFTTKVGPFA